MPNQSIKGNDTTRITENRWVWWFTILVVILTTIPYLLGFSIEQSSLRSNDKWVFSGFVFGVEDGNSYVAKSLRGSAGDWLFRTPYTAYPQKGFLAFLPYILLGKLVSPPGQHEQILALFHLFRITGIGLVIFATYDFISVFINQVNLRRLGLIWAILGGGLGWLVIFTGKSGFLGSLPLDFYSPETFGFLSIYGIPHLALARACMLWCLACYVKSYKLSKIDVMREGLHIGFLWMIAVIAQPLTAGIMGILIGGHFIISFVSIKFGWFEETRFEFENVLRLISISAFFPTLFLVYNLVSFSTDSFLKAWTSQNIITSPHPLHYLLAYGVLLPFGVRGGKAYLESRKIEGIFLVYWVALFPFLAYAPTNLQRRLPEGVWVALVVLALSGLFINQKDEDSKAGKVISRIITALLLPTSLLLLIGGISATSKPGFPLFRPLSEISSFEFIRENSNPTDLVLSSYETGNALPAWAPVHVLIGHGPESIRLEELRISVKNFFQQTTLDMDRKKMLEEFRVRYVFWGPLERSLGDWNPLETNFLLPVYENGDYIIFEYYSGDFTDQ